MAEKKSNITVEYCIARVEVAKNLGARPKIDEVDARILSALLKDPRTSFAEIAKDCKLSINAIRMRFKRLKEAGVIKGAIMQVNPRLLGHNCVAVLRIQADANNMTSVFDFVEKVPHVVHSIQMIGKCNIASIGVLKNVDELAHIVDCIKSHPHVSTVETAIWVDVVWMDHPENLIIEPFDGLPYTTESLPKHKNPKPTIVSPDVVSKLAEENYFNASHELDKIDMQIIGILSENARMPFRKIAKQLDVSTNTVIRRYKKLRKDIAHFSSITLDLRKIGYIGTANFLIKVSHQHSMPKVFDEILRIPNVIVAIRVLGNVDIFVAAPVANFKQLFKLNQGISKIPGVMQIELSVTKPFPTWPLNMFSKLLSKQPQTT